MVFSTETPLEAGSVIEPAGSVLDMRGTEFSPCDGTNTVLVHKNTMSHCDDNMPLHAFYA